MQDEKAVRTPVGVYRCPSDTAPKVIQSDFIGSFGEPAGDTIALSSYCLNLGLNDALAFGPNYSARPVDQYSGAFAFNRRRKTETFKMAPAIRLRGVGGIRCFNGNRPAKCSNENTGEHGI